jgi:hypothetical protein
MIDFHRNSASFELVDPVVRGRDILGITEERCKLCVNFSRRYPCEIEKFDGCAVVDFHSERQTILFHVAFSMHSHGGTLKATLIFRTQ